MTSYLTIVLIVRVFQQFYRFVCMFITFFLSLFVDISSGVFVCLFVGHYFVGLSTIPAVRPSLHLPTRSEGAVPLFLCLFISFFFSLLFKVPVVYLLFEYFVGHTFVNLSTVPAIRPGFHLPTRGDRAGAPRHLQWGLLKKV